MSHQLNFLKNKNRLYYFYPIKLKRDQDELEQKKAELERRNSRRLSKADVSQLAELQKQHGATPVDVDIEQEAANKK